MNVAPVLHGQGVGDHIYDSVRHASLLPPHWCQYGKADAGVLVQREALKVSEEVANDGSWWFGKALPGMCCSSGRGIRAEALSDCASPSERSSHRWFSAVVLPDPQAAHCNGQPNEAVGVGHRSALARCGRRRKGGEDLYIEGVLDQ